jgi:hypothetical protein
MLSHLDRSLFPDRCEVIEIIPSQRYVYVIFKNGHSSFDSFKIINSCRILINQQIQKLNNIDVIIRNPKDRLPSGINTFIQHTLRDNPDLDPLTVEWFALNYLSLNRHYVSQFSWLLNLARYSDPNTTLNFLPMSAVGDITGLDRKPIGIQPASKELINRINLITNNEMYQRIDAVVFGCIGQSMTFTQLLQQIKIIDSPAYEYVIGHAQQILNPTYALSQT